MSRCRLCDEEKQLNDLELCADCMGHADCCGLEKLE